MKKNYQKISIKIEKFLKKDFTNTLNEMGLDITTAIIIFAKEVVRTGKIPFNIEIDPFYQSANLNEIKRRIDDYEAGRTEMVEMSMEEFENMISET